MKCLKPRAILCLILAALLTQAAPMQTAYGQNEEMDGMFEEDFEAPPGTFSEPPPPPPMDEYVDSPPAGYPSDDMEYGDESPYNAPGSMNIGNTPTGGGRSSPTTQGGGSGSTRQGKGIVVAPPSENAKAARKNGAPPIADANIEDITNENYPDVIESFDYPNAEISDIIKAISQLTGKNFIIDPGVRGKISIVAPSQITVAEAYKAFLSALAINGFTVVPSGKFLKVKSARNAQRDSLETYSGRYYPDADVMITRIIHLKHISADEVNKRLRILASKDGEMTPYEPTNSLIISDFGSNIERVMKIINELDRPGFEEQLAVLPIRYAKSKDLADLINQIINKEASPGGSRPGFGAGVPRFRSRTATQGSGSPEELSLVAPDDRTNALIVVGNKAGIAKVRDLVKKLDYKLDPAEAGGVFVYYVKYGEAEKIAQTLSGVAQTATTGGTTGQSGASATRPGTSAAPSPLDRQAIFGGDVKITADKNTNSLVITASKQDFEAVKEILNRIDIPRDQVFVEAIIMEMNTQKVRNWNPTIYYLDPSSNGVGRAGFSRSGSLANILNPTGDQGAVLGFGTGQKLQFSLGDRTIEVPNILSFIQLIQSNVEANILSTPQILALDNEEAIIEVGDRIPIGVATTRSTTGFESTEPKYEDATIKLTITPFIRPDSNVVRLNIEQSVKQPNTSLTQGSPAALQDSTVVISNRSIKTNIVVNNGDTAVLGGLIRDSESLDEVKVPILGDIPVLGWLFKSRQVRAEKINLVVFLTPKIIRNTEDSHNLLGRKTNERIDWLKKNFSGRDPYGKKIDDLPRASQSTLVDEPEDIEPITGE